ncbi:hypothetical protein S83_024853, partial [Arachis hypogaea]
ENRVAIDFLYQAIYKVREEMVKRFQKRKTLHAGIQNFEKIFILLVIDVIERYTYGDANLNYKLISEMRIFKNVEQDFGRQSAIRERNTVMS